MMAQGLFRSYAKYLPVRDLEHLADMGEGRTPVVRSRWIGPRAGLPELYFKLEQLNPSGSYKDRFAGMMISILRERGQKRFLATSSGNTGAALAAYSARYGIECHLFVLERTPVGKLSQMLAHGAKLYRVAGFGTSAKGSSSVFERLREVEKAGGTPLLVSAFCQSPEGMEGVKTLAYELVEQLENVDHVFLPVGGGGLLTATWRGYRDLVAEGFSPPKIDAAQPRPNDTVVMPLRCGAARAP
jgi:threonine synthase